MTYLITFNDLISKIHNKINKYREGNKLISKKEVEDFIYFLRNTNQNDFKIFFTQQTFDHLNKKSSKC